MKSRTGLCWIIACSLWLLCSCSGSSFDSSSVVNKAEVGLVGVDPISKVYLFEQNSTTLLHWKRANVKNRVVVHFDGHGDVDWLPDRTITRLAAADVKTLAEREIHPYAMDSEIYSGFAIYNFIYPAIRMGMIKKFFWVVPDNTFANTDEVSSFIRETIAAKLQGISLEEIESLEWKDSAVQGTLYGIPVFISELEELPTIEEPVLLDLDMDYFTTISARTAEVADRPSTSVEAFVEELKKRELKSDLITICHSTVGGYFPVYERWMGGSAQRWLSNPALKNQEIALAEERTQVGLEMRSADFESAKPRLERLTQQFPDDASMWLVLADARRRLAQPLDATRAFERSLELDPMLIHTPLFDADRAWLSGRWMVAEKIYRAYLETQPDSPYRTYAMRRRADCLAKLGKTQAALIQYREVIAAAPDHGDTRLEYGILLRELGDGQGALRQLHEARAILPERAVYALALGTTQLMRGDLISGVPHLESAVDLQPTLARARVNLAAAYLQMDRLQEAASHAGEALRVVPNNPRFMRVVDEIQGRGVEIPGAVR